MPETHRSLAAPRCTFAAALCVAAVTVGAATQGPSLPAVTLMSGRVAIAGTSNIHPYTASTTDVRVVRAKLAPSVSSPTAWDDVLKSGALEAFEIAIAAGTLSSPKEGLDKNMHKALKVTEHPAITFRLLRLEATAGGPAGSRAIGLLTIAGVEREVAVNLNTQVNDSSLVVKGEVQLLMTDFGITPPKAMLGMLKTDPKVTVMFETVLGIPLT